MLQANDLLKTKEKEIEGTNYIVTQFTGRKALKIKMKIVKMLAPIISSLTSSVKTNDKSVMDSDIDFSVVGEAVSKLFEIMPEDDLIDFIIDMLSMTQKDNVLINSKTFEFDFVGNFTTMYKVLYFVIQVNYPDFFQMGASIGSLTDKFLNQKQIQNSKE
jgi:hypothetical protein